MVNKAEVGGEVAKSPGIFSLLESLTPSMWLQLLKGFGDKSPMDPAQISQMVKKILGDTPKEGRPEIGHLVKILNTTQKEVHLKPALSEGTIKETKPGEARPRPMPVAKLAEGDGVAKPIFLERPNLSQPGSLRMQIQAPIMQDLQAQSAVKEVVKAIYQLLPPTGEKSERGSFPTNPVTRVKEGSNAEFMEKERAPTAEIKPKTNELPKNDFRPTIANPIRSESRPLETRTFEPRPNPSVNPSTENKMPEGTQSLNLQPKKGPEADLINRPQTQSHQPVLQAPKAEQTSIPSAPYSSQTPSTDLRRKEKKKNPTGNPWDEEEEEDPEKRYPRDKQ